MPSSTHREAEEAELTIYHMVFLLLGGKGKQRQYPHGEVFSQSLPSSKTGFEAALGGSPWNGTGWEQHSAGCDQKSDARVNQK